MHELNLSLLLYIYQTQSIKCGITKSPKPAHAFWVKLKTNDYSPLAARAQRSNPIHSQTKNCEINQKEHRHKSRAAHASIRWDSWRVYKHQISLMVQKSGDKTSIWKRILIMIRPTVRSWAFIVSYLIQTVHWMGPTQVGHGSWIDRPKIKFIWQNSEKSRPSDRVWESPFSSVWTPQCGVHMRPHLGLGTMGTERSS